MTAERLVVPAGQPDAAAIARAADVIRRGGIVAYPTDTLYGLAADARNARAIARLFEIKGRAADSAIPLIASDPAQAELAGVFSAIDRRLADAFWPGPLAIVVPARPAIVPAVLGGGHSLAIRVPAHDVARALASASGFAITATSANVSGERAVDRPDDLSAAVVSGVDLIVDAGPSPGGPPSTIVECVNGVPIERRAGATAWDRVIHSLR